MMPSPRRKYRRCGGWPNAIAGNIASWSDRHARRQVRAERMPTSRQKTTRQSSNRATISLITVEAKYTAKQGQYLAFVYHYTKIHRRAPAESEIQQYFEVTPPTVHDMIMTLERRGLIARTAGVARSIRLLVPPEDLPDLE
jgi:hypothetical protein